VSWMSQETINDDCSHGAIEAWRAIVRAEMVARRVNLVEGDHSSKIATARVHPADPPAIFTGKHET
jgi:hypothetical protein